MRLAGIGAPANKGGRDSCATRLHHHRLSALLARIPLRKAQVSGTRFKSLSAPRTQLLCLLCICNSKLLVGGDQEPVPHSFNITSHRCDPALPCTPTLLSLYQDSFACSQSGVGLTPLNRMSYYFTKSEEVGDPKALVRTSGLMLLILVEVRGPIWITSFVTQDANQLQSFEHVTFRLNSIEPIRR